jgi:hypothetical protein
MDAFRFESLMRSLATASSRRRIFSAALSGALGLVLGASSSEDVAAKKKCPPCKKRKHGKCKTIANGTACSGGTCQSGNCDIAVVPTPPSFCEGQLDGTDCAPGKKCSAGVCAAPPGCPSFGAGCTGDPGYCSGRCSCADGDGDGNCDGASGTCNPGSDGKPCNRDLDCTSAKCVGFICRAA